MKNKMPSCIIEKEEVSSIKFSKKEYLNTPKKRALRSYYLNRASKLGNLLKTKVNIHFKDRLNKSMIVNTTIWAVTSEFVILKKGVTIPIKSITYID